MTTNHQILTEQSMAKLVTQIHQWGHELGFQQLAIADTQLKEHGDHLSQWLADEFHGEMHYMTERAELRRNPEQLLPGTCRIITVRMDYLPEDVATDKFLDHPQKAYISRYALGRDYHKVIRKRLQKLADKISAAAGDFGYRAFVDSAPVLEKALAEKSGLGWIGKHTLLLNRQAGSWFFLGELFTDLPLPVDPPTTQHCGSCSACIDICPTQAIIEPYRLDARRCISYLTIEYDGSIPVELRKPMGNRIFGCDDCQLCCPWNRYANFTQESDFKPRHQLDDIALTELFGWNEATFLKKTEGSAIRRTGYRNWLRNIAIALGNAEPSTKIIQALQAKADFPDPIVREHIAWALEQQKAA